MKIIREKPCQRLHHRVTAPIKVTLESGESYIAANWSLGGLRLDGLSHLPPIGNLLNLILELPFQGFDISFEVRAEVVRHASETGTIGVKFIELSERANDLMSHFIDDLIRGKMASVDDTICRIDIPVTPISTKPETNPKDEIPGRRWPVKTILFSIFYVLLGVSVFSYLAFLLYINLMKLEVTSAVVSAPLYAVDMPIDGEFIPVKLKPGMKFKKDQKIARIINIKLESKIDELTVRLEARRRDLIRAEERFRVEQNRLKIFTILKSTERDVIRAEVNAARENLSASDAYVGRMKTLYEKGLIENYKLDEAIERRAKSETKLIKAQRQLEKLTTIAQVSGRKHIGHSDFALDLDLLALELEKANSEVRLASMELEKLETKRDNLIIRSPYDGKIASLLISHNAVLPKGRRLLTLEKNIQPEVTAFLNQTDVVHIGMHDEANVYIPSLDKHIKGQVLSINRNAPEIDDDASYYKWRGEDAKHASVRLRLMLEHDEHEIVKAGLPAVVTFSKRAASNAYRTMKSDLEKLDM